MSHIHANDGPDCPRCADEAKAAEEQAAREEYLRRNGEAAPNRWSKREMKKYLKLASERPIIV